MNTYQQRLAERKAEYAAKRPTPAPLQETLPQFYQIINIKLSTCHQAWYVPIQLTTYTTEPTCITHFAHIKQCGRPLQHTRHYVSFFCSPPDAQTLQDILDTPPEFTLYTRPFIFHNTEQAKEEIKHILNTQL